MPRAASPSERRSYLPPQHDVLGNRIPGTGIFVPFGDPRVSTTTVPQGTLVSGTPVGLFHSQVPTVEYNRARDWAASIDAETKGTASTSDAKVSDRLSSEPASSLSIATTEAQ